MAATSRATVPCFGVVLRGVLAAVFLLGRTRGFAPSSLSLRSRVLAPSSPFGSVVWVRNGSTLPPTKQTRRVRRRTTCTSLSMSSTTSDSPSVPKSLFSASILVAFDVLLRRGFKRLAISFPSSLAGCGILFATLLAAPNGEKIYNVLSPGAALLAKWLPVFFVPSLITLPLADGLGSAMEFFKVAIVVVGGFYFSLLTTAWSVLGVRKLVSGTDSEDTTDHAVLDVVPPGVGVNDDLTPPPKAFSDSFATLLRASTALSAAAALTASTAGDLTTVANPLCSIFMLMTTLNTYVFGARRPKKFNKIVHPLVTCTALTWLTAALLGFGTGKSFKSVLKSYRTGTLDWATFGAGDVLLFLLGPAVVSLACQMYDRRKLMQENTAEVGTAVGVSSVGGLFGTAAFVRLLNIGNPVFRLSLLSRNITSPLAMAIASILGADVSLAVTIVVISGLIGANYGASILDSFGIKDAVARGMGIGAAAHGLGTAAFANEKDAFPFAAISMALTACAATVLVSIPAIKRVILQLALGW